MTLDRLFAIVVEAVARDNFDDGCFAIELINRVCNGEATPKVEKWVYGNKEKLGKLAEQSLRNIPVLPLGDEDPTIQRCELHEVFHAVEVRTNLFPYLSDKGKAKVSKEINELKDMIESQPWRFREMRDVAKNMLETKNKEMRHIWVMVAFS